MSCFLCKWKNNRLYDPEDKNLVYFCISYFFLLSRPLSPDELSTGGILMFTLKDHDLFGRNDFLGECFFPLESIPFATNNTKLQDLPQIHLPLTLPKDANSDILQTLESRQYDRTATEFVKKERAKLIPSPNAHN